MAPWRGIDEACSSSFGATSQQARATSMQKRTSQMQAVEKCGKQLSVDPEYRSFLPCPGVFLISIGARLKHRVVRLASFACGPLADDDRMDIVWTAEDESVYEYSYSFVLIRRGTIHAS